MVFGSAATNAVDSVAGILLVSLFAGGDKAVANGDVERQLLARTVVFADSGCADFNG